MTMCDFPAAVTYLEQSLADLDRHELKIGCSCGRELRRSHNQDATYYQLWWTNTGSRISKDFLWDAFSVAASAREQFEIQVASLSLKIVAGSTADTKTPPPTLLFKYHPLRYRWHRPYSRALSAYAESARGKSIFSEDAFRMAASVIMSDDQDAVTKTRLRYKINKYPRWFNEAVEMGIFFSEYHRTGKNIFDFPSALVEQFKKTDIEDFHLDHLRLPYSSLYLSFPPQTGIAFRGGWVPDGTYVSCNAPGMPMQFAMTFAPTAPEYFLKHHEFAEPLTVIAFTPQQMAGPVGISIDMVISDHFNELRQDQQRDVTHSETMQFKDKTVQIIDKTAENSLVELAEVDARRAALTEMMRLAVNALAYLNTYPEDVRQAWPRVDGLPSDRDERPRKVPSRP